MPGLDPAEDAPTVSSRAAQVVFHAERGLEWVALAQKHQHELATALFTWSCATVTVTFYATFLPALICAPCRLVALCLLSLKETRCPQLQLQHARLFVMTYLAAALLATGAVQGTMEGTCGSVCGCSMPEIICS